MAFFCARKLSPVEANVHPTNFLPISSPIPSELADKEYFKFSSPLPPYEGGKRRCLKIKFKISSSSPFGGGLRGRIFSIYNS
jgi:hypothetical protein